MNKDINLTMFFGQSMFTELDDEKKKSINTLCDALSKIVGYDNKTNEWNPDTFNELCKCFESFKKLNQNKEKCKKANSMFLEIKDMISLTKRFQPKSSPFCEALTKGYWILIEQSESANIEIMEKFIQLCGDNPVLKIIKGIKEVTYKRNNLENPQENIYNDFRIFFTFNPYNS